MLGAQEIIILDRSSYAQRSAPIDDLYTAEHDASGIASNSINYFNWIGRNHRTAETGER